MRQKLSLMLAGLAALGLLSGCGGSGQDGSAGDTGGVSAQVIWPDPGASPGTVANAAANAAALVHPLAAPNAVVTMRFVVTGTGMTQMQQDFGASAGTGTMTLIPVGSNRTLTISALDASSSTLYTGASSTFAVSANSDTSVSVAMAPASGVAVRPWSPTNVSALAGSATATVSWDSVSGASGYNVYWSTSSGVNTSNINRIVGVASPYAHTGRINGTKYFYIVTATNSVGESIASSEVSATPTASTTTGTLTVFLTNVSAVGTVTVKVDGVNAGSFTSHWISNFPQTCGLNDNATFTMTLSAGSHSISGADQGKLTWGPATISITGGGCLVYQLF
jgi:hypothetical protein